MSKTKDKNKEPKAGKKAKGEKKGKAIAGEASGAAPAAETRADAPPILKPLPSFVRVAGKKAAAKPKAAAKADKKEKKEKKAEPIAISNDDIALRAYFIAENRRNAGVHGDEHGDWVEAERQLRAEAAKKAKAK